MKHSLQVTLILVTIFFITQLIGLAIIDANSTVIRNETTGEITTVVYEDTGETKQTQVSNTQAGVTAVVLISLILIATGVVLLLAKYKKFKVWEYWYYFAATYGVYKAIQICLNSTDALPSIWLKSIAMMCAIGMMLWVIKAPNIVILNVTQILVFSGIAAAIVRVINNFLVVVVLLILISIYDMIAVWQSKHMIKLAKFQTNTKIFAGLSIPYKVSKSNENKHDFSTQKPAKGKSEGVKSAILGGGDIAFPLLFAGVLVEKMGFMQVIIIPVVVTFALFLLLYFAKKDRFYPAMPFITAGCFVGYGLMLLL